MLTLNLQQIQNLVYETDRLVRYMDDSFGYGVQCSCCESITELDFFSHSTIDEEKCAWAAFLALIPILFSAVWPGSTVFCIDFLSYQEFLMKLRRDVNLLFRAKLYSVILQHYT